MRLPGAAYLTIRVAPRDSGSRLTVRTDFEPAGLLGHAFWFAELPAHKVVFSLMTVRLAGLIEA